MKPYNYDGHNHGNMDDVAKWADSSNRGDGPRRRSSRRAQPTIASLHRLTNKRARNINKATCKEEELDTCEGCGRLQMCGDDGFCHDCDKEVNDIFLKQESILREFSEFKLNNKTIEFSEIDKIISDPNTKETILQQLLPQAERGAQTAKYPARDHYEKFVEKINGALHAQEQRGVSESNENGDNMSKCKMCEKDCDTNKAGFCDACEEERCFQGDKRYEGEEAAATYRDEYRKDHQNESNVMQRDASLLRQFIRECINEVHHAFCPKCKKGECLDPGATCRECGYTVPEQDND
jgi:hypothetical protein